MRGTGITDRYGRLGRLMESEWLAIDGTAHAFRWHGPMGGHTGISECRQAEIGGSEKPTPDASRCERCGAIMALPGMKERER